MVAILKKIIKHDISNNYECERIWSYVNKVTEYFKHSKIVCNDLKTEWLDLIYFIQTKPSIYLNDLGCLCLAQYHLNEALESVHLSLTESQIKFREANRYLIKYFIENTNKCKCLAASCLPPPASNHSFYLKVNRDFSYFYEKYSQIYWSQKMIETKTNWDIFFYV